jgi:hypothetical protein
MRAVLFLALLAACSAKSNPTDDPACEATLARAQPCMDELVLADVTDPAMRAKLEAEMRSEPAPADDTAQMHRMFCGKKPGYTTRVKACTAETTCSAFAACVLAKP